MNQEKYHKVRSVTRRLDMSERTIRKWIADGQLKVVRVGTRSIRIPESELQKLVTIREAA